MAGQGRRFADAGYAMPKALVPALGRPMISWALESLPRRAPHAYVFVCLREHLDRFRLDEVIEQQLGAAPTIVAVSDTPPGQAATVLRAEEYLTEEPLLIHNVDTFFGCDFSFIEDASISGAIPYTHSIDPAMSFLQMDTHGVVTAVAEKKQISSHATVGCYYFARGVDFASAARQMIARNVQVQSEFFVGPVYNELLARGDRVLGVRARFMWDLGTPEKLQHFERHYCDS
jgi:dTDP-glucose pyrophosphorylase